MARRRRLYEGKAKNLFEGPEPGTIVLHFKDDAVVSGSDKQGVITGKGVLNNRISEYIMQRLNEIGVPTHFIRRLNMREQIVHEVEMIPVQVAIRNVVAGSMVERFGIEEGMQLPRSIVEYYWKGEGREKTLVSEEHVTAFGWATPQDIDDMLSMALRVNDYLTGLLTGAGLKLIDFKLKFGRHYDENGDMRIFLADEISPDNCRFWDIKTNEKLDMDRFRLDLGGAAEGYQEVARRLGVMPESGPGDVVETLTMQ